MPTHRKWPIAVIGAGPTGLTLASLIARYGIEVLVVERNPTTVEEPRAVSIDDEALRTVQAAGAVEAVLSRIVPGYGSDYYSARGQCFLRVHPTTREYGYSRRNAFRQPIFESQMRQHLIEQPQSEVWFCSELIDFKQSESGVVLTVRCADGGEAQVECDYMVACDGGRSFVRDRLGIRLVGSTFRERWLILDIEQTNESGRDTKVFCDPARPGISLPGPDGTRRFEFMLHEGEEEATVIAPEFTTRLLELYGNDQPSQIRRARVYTFHARIAQQWRSGRIFLAGDAAHLTPPFAGQGMNSGIRDAHNLAWKLAAVVDQRLGPRLLDSYEQERRKHAWHMIRLAINMGRVMMPRSRANAVLMQTFFYLLHFYPAARDYFAQMRYKPKPRFESGFLIRHNDEGKELVGRLLVQPNVITESGTTVLLDEVLGDSFALIATPKTSPAVFNELPQDLCRVLEVNRIAIQHSGETRNVPGVRIVETPDGDFLQHLPAGFLFVRPDRYVAAWLPLTHLKPALSEVGTLIGRTWN